MLLVNKAIFISTESDMGPWLYNLFFVPINSEWHEVTWNESLSFIWISSVLWNCIETKDIHLEIQNY